MPLHLNSITNEITEELITSIITDGMNRGDRISFDDGGKGYILQSTVEDTLSHKTIGRMAYTIKIDEEEKKHLIKDINFFLTGGDTSRIWYCQKIMVDDTEYQQIETEDGSKLVVEVVNRNVEKAPLEALGDIHERDLIRTAIFPFELSVFENIEDFNKSVGFSEKIQAGDTELFVYGYSETFTMPQMDEAQPHSFLLGKVIAFRDVNIRLGNNDLSFVLAKVQTALGLVPVAMGRDVFDLEKLKAGCILAMAADIVADISKDTDFKYIFKKQSEDASRPYDKPIENPKGFRDFCKRAAELNEKICKEYRGIYSLPRIGKLEDPINGIAYILNLKKEKGVCFAERIHRFCIFLQDALLPEEYLDLSRCCFTVRSSNYSISYCVEGYKESADHFGWIEDDLVCIGRHRGGSWIKDLKYVKEKQSQFFRGDSEEDPKFDKELGYALQRGGKINAANAIEHAAFNYAHALSERVDRESGRVPLLAMNRPTPAQKEWAEIQRRQKIKMRREQYQEKCLREKYAAEQREKQRKREEARQARAKKRETKREERKARLSDLLNRNK